MVAEVTLPDVEHLPFMGQHPCFLERKQRPATLLIVFREDTVGPGNS